MVLKMNDLKPIYKKYKRLFVIYLTKNSLTINTISLFIIYGTSFLISLLVLPHLVKNYGLVKWGEIIFFQIVLNYLIWIIDWSFNQYGSKFVSINFNNYEKLKIVFRETWTSQFILTLISLFISLFIILLWGKTSLILPITLILIGNFLQPYWFLNGLEKIYESALIQLFHKCFFAFLTISLINNNSKIETYFMFYGISFFLTGIFYQLRVLSQYKNLVGLVSFNRGFRTIKKSARLFLSSILGSIINSFLPIIVGSLLGSEKLGMFNIADRIKGISVQLSHPLSHSIFPKMTKAYYEGKDSGNKLFKYIFLILLTITLLSFILINIYIKEVVSYFTDQDILKIVGILRILLFSFIINVIEELMVNQYFVPNGLYKYINKLKYLIFTTVLITGLPLIYLFGIKGAAYANLISELTGLIYILCKFNQTKNKPNIQEIF